VLSGLVPLGADVMRYLEGSYNNDLRVIFHWKYDRLMEIRMLKHMWNRSEIVQQILSFGAQVQTHISRKVTHLVVSASRTRTQKVRQAAKYPHIQIVNQQWLMDSMSKWQKEDESQYLVGRVAELDV
jgi:hypothetical protein